MEKAGLSEEAEQWVGEVGGLMGKELKICESSRIDRLDACRPDQLLLG